MEIDLKKQQEQNALTNKKSFSSLVFRAPNKEDGAAVYDLVAHCPPLDKNSMYCNFLQTSHFYNTCIIALDENKAVGFISAYLRPDDEDILFIWQVAVDNNFRGRGLAYSMLMNLLARNEFKQLKAIETTITKENKGSWKLFEKIEAQSLTQANISIFLDKVLHFKKSHETEYLYHIPLIQ